MTGTFDIQKIFVCPQCKGNLRLEVFSEDQLGIKQGKLTCSGCHKDYLIEDYILYLQPRSHSYHGKNGWSISPFDSLYKRIEYYDENPWEGREKMGGVPRLITDYDYPKIKGRLLQWLNPQDNDLILDVGAGDGYFIFAMMEKYKERDLRFIGIDPSEEHIKWLAYRKKKEKKSNILVVIGDARNFPFQEEVFDVISCTEVIEHIPDKRGVIGEISRCLKSRGRLVLSTPSKRAMDFWLVFVRAYRFFTHKQEIKKDIPYDEPLYPIDLKKYVADAGFSMLNFELNVILPPQSHYFSIIPHLLTSYIVRICAFTENHMKVIFSRFALHIVLHAQKTKESSRCRKMNAKSSCDYNKIEEQR
jgi:SAM-dependent methyltransferase